MKFKDVCFSAKKSLKSMPKKGLQKNTNYENNYAWISKSVCTKTFSTICS